MDVKAKPHVVLCTINRYSTPHHPNKKKLSLRCAYDPWYKNNNPYYTYFTIDEKRTLIIFAPSPRTGSHRGKRSRTIRS